jgi:hypothetical protein
MNKENFKRISISFPPEFFKRLEEVQKELGGSFSEIIRHGFDRFYMQIFRPEVYGYQAGSKTAKDRINKNTKKISQGIQIDTIRLMDNATLSKWLIDVGFSPARAKVEGNDTQETYFEIRDREVGRAYCQVYYDLVSKIESPATIFTFDELIAQLKKEKKI